MTEFSFLVNYTFNSKLWDINLEFWDLKKEITFFQYFVAEMDFRS